MQYKCGLARLYKIQFRIQIRKSAISCYKINFLPRLPLFLVLFCSPHLVYEVRSVLQTSGISIITGWTFAITDRTSVITGRTSERSLSFLHRTGRYAVKLSVSTSKGSGGTKEGQNKKIYGNRYVRSYPSTTPSAAL